MQTETITQVKKFKLKFETFDDWVYIKCSDRKDPYLLPRKFFNEMEAKHAIGIGGRKSKISYNWLLKLTWTDTYVAYSEDHLKQYFEESGTHYEPNWQTYIVDPLPLLKAGVKDRYYRFDGNNHYLYLGNKPMRCPYVIDLRGYHSKQELVRKLLKNPKILKAEIEENPYWMEEDEKECIQIVYMPSQREFDKSVVEKDSSCDRSFKITNSLKISNFKKKDD